MKGVLRDVRFKALRLLAPVVILLFTASILWGIHPAFAAPKISVLVDGRRVSADVPPFIENGRTLVPVRALAESLGAKVIWEEKEKLSLLKPKARRSSFKSAIAWLLRTARQP
ncbi:MAG: copper amine oxidase N-terminal domain-containing protein [Firmicutes bacterium]|nr:copper amine oxidase N-terminal domain-containing protein [Bacillota bacterium]